MGHPLSLLTATLLVAQTPDATVINSGKSCSCQKNVATVGYVQPVPAEYSASSGRRLFNRAEAAPAPSDRPILSRIQGWFGRGQGGAVETSSPAVVTSEPMVIQAQPTSAPRMMQRLPQKAIEPAVITPAPVPASGAVKIVTPTAYQAPANLPAAQPVSATKPAAPAAVAASPAVAPSNRPNRISPELVQRVGHAEDYSWITGQVRIENGVHVLHYATPEVVDRHNGHMVLVSDRDLRDIADGAYVCVRGQVSSQGNGRPTMYRAQAIDKLPTN